MSRRCARPELQGQILEAARARRALDLELSLHAAGCRACRTAAERLRRMVAVWDVDVADDARCAAAADRFVAQRDRAEQRSPRPPTLFVVVGAAATAALLLVLGGHHLRPSRDVGEKSTPSVLSAGPELAAHRALVNPGSVTAPAPLPASRRGHVRGPRGVVDLADGTRVELGKGESARVMLADGTTSDLRGPCLVEFWSSTSEVGGWKMSYLPVASELQSVPAAEEPVAHKRRCDGHDVRCRSGAMVAKEKVDAPAPSATPSGAPMGGDPQLDRAWGRAAEALRRDDFGAADQAFGDLELTGDRLTRDAARLARAELWIAHGRAVSARAILEDLSKNGATSLVRQRAAEFLGRPNH